MLKTFFSNIAELITIFMVRDFWPTLKIFKKNSRIPPDGSILVTGAV